jgi:hypothetical protein
VHLFLLTGAAPRPQLHLPPLPLPRGTRRETACFFWTSNRCHVVTTVSGITIALDGVVLCPGWCSLRRLRVAGGCASLASACRAPPITGFFLSGGCHLMSTDKRIPTRCVLQVGAGSRCTSLEPAVAIIVCRGGGALATRSRPCAPSLAVESHPITPATVVLSKTMCTKVIWMLGHDPHSPIDSLDGDVPLTPVQNN